MTDGVRIWLFIALVSTAHGVGMVWDGEGPDVVATPEDATRDTLFEGVRPKKRGVAKQLQGQLQAARPDAEGEVPEAHPDDGYAETSDAARKIIHHGSRGQGHHQHHHHHDRRHHSSHEQGHPSRVQHLDTNVDDRKEGPGAASLYYTDDDQEDGQGHAQRRSSAADDEDRIAIAIRNEPKTERQADAMMRKYDRKTAGRQLPESNRIPNQVLSHTKRTGHSHHKPKARQAKVMTVLHAEAPNSVVGNQRVSSEYQSQGADVESAQGMGHTVDGLTDSKLMRLLDERLHSQALVSLAEREQEVPLVDLTSAAGASPPSLSTAISSATSKTAFGLKTTDSHVTDSADNEELVRTQERLALTNQRVKVLEDRFRTILEMQHVTAAAPTIAPPLSTTADVTRLDVQTSASDQARIDRRATYSGDPEELGDTSNRGDDTVTTPGDRSQVPLDLRPATNNLPFPAKTLSRNDSGHEVQRDDELRASNHKKNDFVPPPPPPATPLIAHESSEAASSSASQPSLVHVESKPYLSNQANGVAEVTASSNADERSVADNNLIELSSGNEFTSDEDATMESRDAKPQGDDLKSSADSKHEPNQNIPHTHHHHHHHHHDHHHQEHPSSDHQEASAKPHEQHRDHDQNLQGNHPSEPEMSPVGEQVSRGVTGHGEDQPSITVNPLPPRPEISTRGGGTVEAVLDQSQPRDDTQSDEEEQVSSGNLWGRLSNGLPPSLKALYSDGDTRQLSDRSNPRLHKWRSGVIVQAGAGQRHVAVSEPAAHDRSVIEFAHTNEHNGQQENRNAHTAGQDERRIVTESQYRESNSVIRAAVDPPTVSTLKVKESRATEDRSSLQNAEDANGASLSGIDVSTSQHSNGGSLIDIDDSNRMQGGGTEIEIASKSPSAPGSWEGTPAELAGENLDGISDGPGLHDVMPDTDEESPKAAAANGDVIENNSGSHMRSHVSTLKLAGEMSATDLLRDGTTTRGANGIVATMGESDKTDDVPQILSGTGHRSAHRPARHATAREVATKRRTPLTEIKKASEMAKAPVRDVPPDHEWEPSSSSNEGRDFHEWSKGALRSKHVHVWRDGSVEPAPKPRKQNFNINMQIGPGRHSHHHFKHHHLDAPTEHASGRYAAGGVQIALELDEGHGDEGLGPVTSVVHNPADMDDNTASTVGALRGTPTRRRRERVMLPSLPRIAGLQK